MSSQSAYLPSRWARQWVREHLTGATVMEVTPASDRVRLARPKAQGHPDHVRRRARGWPSYWEAITLRLAPSAIGNPLPEFTIVLDHRARARVRDEWPGLSGLPPTLECLLS